MIYACSCALQDFVHASSEGVATTGARWKAGGGGGGGNRVGCAICWLAGGSKQRRGW